MRSIPSLIKLSPVLLAVLFLAVPAPAAMADTPCCKITDIDTKKGIVSARETATGRQFKFSLTNPILVQRIKVGQGVQADFAAGKVTVVGVDGRYPIIGTAPAAAGTKTAPSVAAKGLPTAKNSRPTSAANKVCCTITAVHLHRGVVSARDNATGRRFDFTTNNKMMIKGLKPGGGLYAHFASKQVSLDGRSACCRITRFLPPSTTFEQGGSEQGGFEQGGYEQGSGEQGGPDAGGGGQWPGDAGGDYGAGQGNYTPGQEGYSAGGGQWQGDSGGISGGGQGNYTPGQEGYATGGVQLQGDRPWYEKEQGPADFGSGAGQWQGDGSGTGTGTNTDPTWMPPPQ